MGAIKQAHSNSFTAWKVLRYRNKEGYVAAIKQAHSNSFTAWKVVGHKNKEE